MGVDVDVDLPGTDGCEPPPVSDVDRPTWDTVHRPLGPYTTVKSRLDVPIGVSFGKIPPLSIHSFSG